MQLVHVARGQLVVPVHEVPLELPRRAQQPGLQERDQVEQLLQVILHGGRGQQQDELLLDLAGELPGLGVAIAEVMGLVDDDDVPPSGEDRRPVRLALGGMDRGDHAVELAPGGLPALAEGGVVVADELDRELAPHLALPLLDQRRRDEDEDRPGEAADHQLREDEPGLDGLAQPDLVAEHGPAAKPPQDGLGRADLVLEQLDVADHRQRDQPVEPGVGGEPGRADRQVELVKLHAGRHRAGGLHDRPVAPIELDGDALLRGHRAVGGLRCARLDDQPKPPRRAVLQPERAVRSGEALGQLRHHDRAGPRVEGQIERPAGGVLDLLDREAVGTQDPGQAQPARARPADRRDFEPVARLQAGRREV